jgi:hypothetical protein
MIPNQKLRSAVTERAYKGADMTKIKEINAIKRDRVPKAGILKIQVLINVTRVHW